MPRSRTFSIGGATWDLFIRVRRDMLREDDTRRTLSLPLGAKIPVDGIVETCGGGAANTSVGLSRLGCSAAFCGVIGSDQWGEKLLDTLENEDVDTTAATVVEGEISSSSIILSVGSGERTILYNAGTNAHLRDPVFDRERAAGSEWIYLNHLAQGDILDDVEDLLERAKGSVGLSWNPGGPQIAQGCAHPANCALLRHTSILLLNAEEALAFTGKSDRGSALRALRKAGAQRIFITDGPNGAIGADGRNAWRCPPVAGAPIVDTTGAGDAFGTGVTWAILQGFDLPEALRAGTINATSVLGTLGAQAGLLTDTEMRKRLRSVPLEVLSF